MFNRLNFQRLAYEIEEMTEEYDHVVLKNDLFIGFHWHGYITKHEKSYYFLITYPLQYPLQRPNFFEVDGPIVTLNEFIETMRKLSLKGGLCLYTHDGGPDSWFEGLTAVDSVKRYERYIDDAQNGVIDFQFLEDRLLMPGYPKSEMKYFTTKEGIEKLKKLGTGNFKAYLIRNKPELYFIYQINNKSSGFQYFNQDTIIKQFFQERQNPTAINGYFTTLDFELFRPIREKDGLKPWLKDNNIPYENNNYIFVDTYKRIDPVFLETVAGFNYSIKVADSDNLFKRVKGVIGNDLEVIQKSKIMLIGLGSIGSEVAIALAKAGVKEFHLFDPEILEIENIVRHHGTFNDLFDYKVDTVKKHILRINPLAKVGVSPFSPLLENFIHIFRQLLAQTSIVIVTCADNEVERIVNYECLQQKKTVIFSSALGHAAYARIFRVIPGKTACYNCVCLNNEEESQEYPSLQDEIDENLPRRVGYRQAGVPGIGIDINIIANMTARMTIQTLLEQNNVESKTYPKAEGDHLLWANHKGWIFDQGLQAKWIKHEKNKYCSYCSQERIRSELYTEQEINELIAKASLQNKLNSKKL